ncbi:MAG TPA: hypothetical protein VEY07_02880 [Thermoplasmata archaeon]|nr:hypothetical protein [Thermoplasmata archaeon]
MGQLADALSVAGGQLSARLRRMLSEPDSKPLRQLLPQSWRFETESESAVLRLELEGSVTAVPDVTERPDVIVKWTQEELVGVLHAGRSNETPRATPPNIRFTSDRGRKAFSLLGTSLGL